jgi:aldehyde:ferredoxin oxidoreductase
MVRVGERIVNLERLFNIREGHTRKDDIIPDRFLEPTPEGTAKGQTCNV